MYHGLLCLIIKVLAFVAESLGFIVDFPRQLSWFAQTVCLLWLETPQTICLAALHELHRLLPIRHWSKHVRKALLPWTV
jgi:hypothetical protein